MCGYSGFWNLKRNYSSNKIIKIINQMTECLSLRGPDDKGFWINKKKNMAFGHRRLSILDLTRNGRQPMISENNRFVIVYNGEIYNFLKLKEELSKENVSFKGNCDTETLLEACSLWGIDKTLNKCSGMYSFVLWDKKKEKLFLVRDRFGIKPIYYSKRNSLIFFGSQSKCFSYHPEWKKEISKSAMSDFFRLGYIPSNKSIYKNTAQVLPGHYIEIDNKGNLYKKCYWNLKKVASNTFNNQEITDLVIQENVEKKLEESVKEHMISDVPIGCFLSGGVDSSIISALMQKNSKNKIKTFNIGFEDQSLDESKYALLVSEHLKTDHTNIIFSNKNLTDLIPKLNSIYDEPFADSSQLPTILLSQVTKKDVKVALSGDGGDEIFAGYNRYTWAKNIKLFYSLTPFYLRKIISKLMRLISAENWDKISFLYPKKLSFFGDKVYKLSNVIELKTFNEIYDNLISQWQSNDLPLKDSFVSKRNNFLLNQKNKTDIVKQMQLLDISTYLPDDILTKVDRASMAYSLEVRVPFLNKDLVKYLFSLSYQNNKFRGNKLILKKILSKYIPKNLVYRPKMGFSIPLEKWLKHQLRDWAEDLLEDKKLNDNILDSKKIKKRWNEHLSGKRNWQYSLWTILMYQSWKFSNK